MNHMHDHYFSHYGIVICRRLLLQKTVGVEFLTCIISMLFRKIFLATLLQKTVTAEEKKPYEGIYHAGKEAYLQVIAKEKRETDSMRFL